jgi:hypothetical protein
MHDFEPTHFHITIGSHEPVLRVESGDTVRTWCVDSGGCDRTETQITDGGARPLDQAVQHATTELMRLLAEDHGLDYRASSELLGQCIRYDVGNVYDPAYTAVAKIEKGLLP